MTKFRTRIAPHILDKLAEAAAADHLDIFGAFHENGSTLVLLGPKEPGYWAHIKQSAEWRDGHPDPIDRWSMRTITKLADKFDATPHFPFGGAPFKPFFTWALKSGSAWQSPVSLLVHETAGLMVSYRGAVELHEILDIPEPAANPCQTCVSKPCETACPSQALTRAGYDLPKCHAYLDTPDGQENLRQGCNVRRSCPVSQSYGRLTEHSAYHMSIFHK